MKKRIIALLLLAALMLPVLAACGEDDSAFLTPEEAQKIALKEMGIKESQADDIHTHGGEYEGVMAYSVHIAVGETEYEYIIRASDGEILLSGNIEE